MRCQSITCRFFLTCEEVQKVETFIQSLVAVRGSGAAAVESQSFAASELPLPVGGDLDFFASACLDSHTAAATELPPVSPAAPAVPFLAAAELPSLYHDGYSSQTALRCARTGDNTDACGDSARDPLIAVQEGVQAVHAANVSA